MSESTWSGSRYLLTFTDDYTRKTFGYLIKSKRQVFDKFVEFKTLAENQTGLKIKKVRTDNGLEYCNKHFEVFFKKNGIIHETTVQYTPEQNGVAERLNWTIIEKTRAMLQDSGLCKKYWGEAVMTAIYVKNRSPTVAVPRATPEELWSGYKTDVSDLSIFGYRVFVHTPKELRKKLDPKSKEYIMVGYCDHTKGYRLADPLQPGKVIKARDVTFLEDDIRNGEKMPEQQDAVDVNTTFEPCNVSSRNKIDDSDVEDEQRESDRGLMRYSTLKLLFAIGNEKDMDIDHLDVSTAFLNSKLDEQIYMKQLSDIGYVQSKCERCVYIKTVNGMLIIVALYVDDLFVFSDNAAEKEKLINVLNKQQRMANRVLLATLSIPLPSAHPEFDRFIETDKSPLEKAQKLVTLLGLSQPPTRISLLKDIVRLNVVILASPQLQELYSWLEIEFHPLEFCSRVDSVIQMLQADENSSLIQYVPALQDVTLVRLVYQVSQVYQTIQFSKLLELAKFTTDFHLERLLVDCVRYNDMQIRIDHGKSCIHFGVDLSEAQREDHPDGPILQAMPSEQIRCQLVNMATVLHRAINVINPNKKKLEREKLRSAMVAHYHETKMKEHQRILGRHKIIEERKEYIEHINTVREEEEMRRQEELQRQQMLVEKKRLEQEREERERKRQQNEIQQIKDRHLKEKMQQISPTSHGQKVLKKLDEDEIKKLDAEQIAAREAEELQKERREMQQKLKSQEKKVDYLERAKRLEEIPLLEKAVEERMQLAKQLWHQQEDERIAVAIEERQEAVATRERLARMKEDHDIFLSKILAERRSIYLEKLQEFEKLSNEERAKRLLKRKIERKAERKMKWEKKRAEAAEQRRLEELRIKQEEEEKRLEEERAKREEEERIRRAEEEAKEAERLAKLKKQAEIARARDAEIERKLEEERQKDKEQASMWRRMDRDHDRDRERDRDSSKSATESWRRNPDKDSDGLKNETERWRKRDDKIEDSSWKRKELERRDTDKWRRNDDMDRWKKDTTEKWRKDDNYDRDDLRDRDRLENRGFDKRDDRDRDRERDHDRDRDHDHDRDRDRDRDRGIDGRGIRDVPRERRGFRRDEPTRSTNQDWRKHDLPQDSPRDLPKRERDDRKDDRLPSRLDDRRRPLEDDGWSKVSRR
ncbi:Eukaryotic translation initiation factor 3 subunit A [Ooceraea biroi]|uniref:Eukaryotic translation initiation factor 3 subunit A n=1 Tax=Ooceraea biroi TaxID=2015173 RepID=A0A026WR34_OOCBI|nr:Eukaryotic translation initiation factor 3 subunit A [Ooceraea biroi]